MKDSWRLEMGCPTLYLKSLLLVHIVLLVYLYKLSPYMWVGNRYVFNMYIRSMSGKRTCIPPQNKVEDVGIKDFICNYAVRFGLVQKAFVWGLKWTSLPHPAHSLDEKCTSKWKVHDSLAHTSNLWHRKLHLKSFLSVTTCTMHCLTNTGKLQEYSVLKELQLRLNNMHYLTTITYSHYWKVYYCCMTQLDVNYDDGFACSVWGNEPHDVTMYPSSQHPERNWIPENWYSKHLWRLSNEVEDKCLFCTSSSWPFGRGLWPTDTHIIIFIL